jgi:ABC-type Fe3+ transport system permease subunit
MDERVAASRPRRAGVPRALVAGGFVIASLLWLAVTVVARARWFDLRCYRLDEASTSMAWVAWFPPHMACLDARGQVLVRDYTESLWLALMWAPIVVALLVAVVWSSRRGRGDT